MGTPPHDRGCPLARSLPPTTTTIAMTTNANANFANFANLNADTTTTTTTTTTHAAATTGPGTAVTMMMYETRAIDGREQAVVRETVEVPYDANDL